MIVKLFLKKLKKKKLVMKKKLKNTEVKLNAKRTLKNLILIEISKNKQILIKKTNNYKNYKYKKYNLSNFSILFLNNLQMKTKYS